VRIEVEPQELISAGGEIGGLGEKLGLLSSAMGQALASGIASGNDPAGMNFGVTYGRQADAFASRLAEAADAFTNVGRMLEVTGYNYRHADAASVAGGPGPSGGIGAQPASVHAGDAPYGPNGATVPPPAKWHLIQPLLNVIPGFGFFAGTAMTWPTGNSALMNVTAAQWSNIARGLSLFEPAMTAAKALAGAQNIPEGGDINQALADLGAGVTLLSNMAAQMATAVSDFATGVQETQDAIRRLLDRLSLDGLWDTVTGFLTGEGDDILREIARDVSTVLENFQNQVEGLVGLIKELGVLLGEAATAFQQWIRPALVGVFGEEHGNILADAVTWYTDVQVGSVVALLGAVADTVALADPNTWKGMADMALSIAKDPSTIDDVLLDMGKEFIALDQIQGDHPGRGIGAAGFNIASLFIPGGALSKTGTLAKGLSATQDLFRGGLPGSPSRLPGSGGNTPDMPELPNAPAVPNVPQFRSPGIPESTLAPAGPGGPGKGGNVPTGSPNGAGPGEPGSRHPDSGAGSAGGPIGDTAPMGVSSSPSGDQGVNQPSPGPSPSGGGDGPGGPSPNGTGSDASGGSRGAGDPSGTSNGGGDSVADTIDNSDGGGTPDSGGSSSHTDSDGSSGPGDDGRSYSMSDGSLHQTSFAPEQLGDNQRVAATLDRHGITREDFVELIQRPTDTLTPDERILVNAVRDDLPAPGPETVMQKVIPPGYFDGGGNLQPARAEDYLDPPNEDFTVNGVGGSVTVAGDTSHLGTPAQIHDGLRLDYTDTPFDPQDAGMHLIRFQADLESPGTYDVPRNSDMGGSDRYDSWDDPFTGNGFTKSGEDVIPEYFATGTRMRDGAEMWEVLDDGTQRLVAVLDRGSWIRQGNPDE
jgi:hypothetical protein